MSVLRDVTLVKVDANANNNKFYRVVEHDDGNVTSYWGRVGVDNPQSTTKRANFDTVVKGKIKRGYKETEIQSSSAPKPAATVNRQVLHKVASTSLASDSKDPALASAIQFMVDQNRHEIVKTSGGVLKVDDSGVVKTPLGIVSAKAIDEAGKILDKVSSNSGKTSKRTLTSDYLTLIPQKVKGRDWADTFFDDGSKVLEQKNLLRQLRSSLDWYNSQDATNDDSDGSDDFKNLQNIFNVKLSTLSSRTNEYKDIVALYNKTRKSQHASYSLKVKNIYKLTYSADIQEAFEKVAKDLGNVKRLWHGTDAGNVLSILREGLFCPPLGDSKFKTSGRLFSINGSGIYNSDESSKALNYSYGYWHGTRNPRCFMFFNDVIMGNAYFPNKDVKNGGRFSAHNAYYGTNGEGKRFNSISVKGGTCGVVNNEMIVWNKEQIMLRYLVEFEA